MKKTMWQGFSVLLSLALLWGLIFPAGAGGMEIGTRVSVMVDALTITSQTEDFTLKTGEGETLRVTLSQPAENFLWQVSRDGGLTWETAPGISNADTYDIINAQPNRDNAGRDVAYQYRVTVTGISGASDSAIIKVLVSDDYAYRTISLRGGDIDVSAYMHDKTRLVITPLNGNSAAALILQAELSQGCLPLLICDVALVNQNDQVVPYFGLLELDFKVGAQYEGQALKAFHLLQGEIVAYSGSVRDGILSITVEQLSPFMVEASADANRLHTVTATAGPGGSIIPCGRVNVAHGAAKTFIFLPDAGYVIGEVLADGSPVSFSGNSYTMSNITEDRTIAVSFTAAAASAAVHTLTISAGEGGSISPSGTIRVRQGAAQTIYFYPDEGYELDRLLINGVPVNVIGNSFTISAVTENATVVASFRRATTQLPDVYKTISAEAGPGGSISPAGDVSVEYGGGMYFYFIPDRGYTVSKVFIDGRETAVSSGSYQFINVVADHSIRVTFKSAGSGSGPSYPTVYHTITAKAGAGGSISPSGSVKVAAGGSQVFTFIARSGYELDAVRVDGRQVEVTGGSYLFTNVSGDHSIEATFKQIAPPPPQSVYHTITASSGEGGSISPQGSVKVAAGGSQTFTFIAFSGYVIDTVRVDGTLQAVTGSSYQFSNINADHRISVSFRQVTTVPQPPPPQPVYHTITAEAGEGGSISPAGTVQVAAGGSQTFYFIADQGYEISSVKVDGVALSATGSSYSFTALSGDHRIAVTFKPVAPPLSSGDYYTITAQAGEGGSISPQGRVQVAGGNSSAWFYFIPDQGYETDKIVIDGQEREAENGSYRFTAVDCDHSIHVTFKASQAGQVPAVYHTISGTTEGRGSISPGGATLVESGGSQTFYFIAEPGYEVDVIYLNGQKQDMAGSQFTVDNVSDDMELSVTFKPAGAASLGHPAACHCLGQSLFANCAVCGWFDRCITPWCWLLPLLLLAALVIGGVLVFRRKS